MESKSNANYLDKSCYELEQVLERRHLLSKPVEYLVKVRLKNKKKKEVWMSEDSLMRCSSGRLILKKFGQSKVGERGVDLHLSKRKSSSGRSEIIVGTIGRETRPKVKRCSKDRKSSCGANRIYGLVEIKKRKFEDEENIKRVKKNSPVEQEKKTTSAKCKQNKESQEKNDIEKNKTEKRKIKLKVVEKRPYLCSNSNKGEDRKGKNARPVEAHTSEACTPCHCSQENNLSASAPHGSFFHQTSQPPTHLPPLVIPSLQCCFLFHLKCHHHHHHECCCAHTNLGTCSKHLTPSPPSSFGHADKKVKVDTPPNLLPFHRTLNIRQTDSFMQLKELSVRKFEGVVQVVLGSSHHSSLKNSFNPKTFTELTTVLRNLAYDSSSVILLTGSGSVFTSGIDLCYLFSCEAARKERAKLMAEMLRDFTNLLISFPKPLVAVVNGSTMGLGVAMLPLCDMVYASDKASFYCPYTLLGQSPEACSSDTFPRTMGFAMANELLLRGRKITALEACQVGLVSQVIWPENLMNEVMVRIKHMTQQSAKALECTKALMRAEGRARLEGVSGKECLLLAHTWACPSSRHLVHSFLRSYLEST